MGTMQSEDKITKSSHASAKQPGNISDNSLSQIREQIKTVMIPLLIKIFHLKLEAQQASSPSSRILSMKPKDSVEEITTQLKNLDEDLKLLLLWCQTCRSQVGKALSELEENGKEAVIQEFTTYSKAHPSAYKSFRDAVDAQQEGAKQHPLPHTYSKNMTDKEENSSLQSEKKDLREKKPWWTKLLGL